MDVKTFTVTVGLVDISISNNARAPVKFTDNKFNGLSGDLYGDVLTLPACTID